VHKLPTLLLLISAYAAATWFPEPGLWARELRLADAGGLLGSWGAQVRAVNVLLAILLFSSGLSATWTAMRRSLSSRARWLSMAGVAWGMPLLAALLAIAALKLFSVPAEIAFAMWVIAAMPVANSSVGWANVMRCNVPLSLSLLILSTCLSPVSSPLLIWLGSRWLEVDLKAGSSPMIAGLELAAFFAIWVLLPVALGAWGAGGLSPASAAQVIPWARRISLVTLLLLNYLNGAACLPSLIAGPATLLWPVAGAFGLVACVVVLFGGLVRSGRVLAGESQSPAGSATSDVSEPAGSGVGGERARGASDRDALLLAVIMRNTGVALVYTTVSMPGADVIGLTIIAYTLVQHIVASMLVETTVSRVVPARDVSCKTHRVDSNR
jgi:bile acid:Na+ symporter, BASS family